MACSSSTSRIRGLASTFSHSAGSRCTSDTFRPWPVGDDALPAEESAAGRRQPQTHPTLTVPSSLGTKLGVGMSTGVAVYSGWLWRPGACGCLLLSKHRRRGWSIGWQWCRDERWHGRSALSWSCHGTMVTSGVVGAGAHAVSSMMLEHTTTLLPEVQVVGGNSLIALPSGLSIAYHLQPLFDPLIQAPASRSQSWRRVCGWCRVASRTDGQDLIH